MSSFPQQEHHHHPAPPLPLVQQQQPRMESELHLVSGLRGSGRSAFIRRMRPTYPRSVYTHGNAKRLPHPSQGIVFMEVFPEQVGPLMQLLKGFDRIIVHSMCIKFNGQHYQTMLQAGFREIRPEEQPLVLMPVSRKD